MVLRQHLPRPRAVGLEEHEVADQIEEPRRREHAVDHQLELRPRALRSSEAIVFHSAKCSAGVVIVPDPRAHAVGHADDLDVAVERRDRLACSGEPG